MNQKEKVTEEYWRLRKIGFRPVEALNAAKSNIRFDELEYEGLVSFEVLPDESADWDNLVGDCYDPKVNSDIDPVILESQEQAEMDRANWGGIWGIVTKVGSEPIDSVWGFIADDWKDSGCDSDAKQSAIDFLAQKYVDESVNFTTYAIG